MKYKIIKSSEVESIDKGFIKIKQLLNEKGIAGLSVSIVEIEGKSEERVRTVSNKLGFDYNTALFCAVDTIYNKKYGVSEDVINNHTPEILFNGKNPFAK